MKAQNSRVNRFLSDDCAEPTTLRLGELTVGLHYSTLEHAKRSRWAIGKTRQPFFAASAITAIVVIDSGAPKKTLRSRQPSISALENI
jgi:hypothetical protein